MIRAQVQITKEQIEWLREKARNKGVSVSQLLRESVELYRAHEENLPEDKKKRALDAVGQYASDNSDVSEAHDDYLAEAFARGSGNGE